MSEQNPSAATLPDHGERQYDVVSYGRQSAWTAPLTLI